MEVIYGMPWEMVKSEVSNIYPNGFPISLNEMGYLKIVFDRICQEDFILIENAKAALDYCIYVLQCPAFNIDKYVLSVAKEMNISQLSAFTHDFLQNFCWNYFDENH